MRRLSLCLAVIVAARAPPPELPAQVPAGATEMLRRLYASRDFSSERFGPARWIESGAAYTTVEPSDAFRGADRKSTRLNSSHSQISYAVFCLKKKKR